MKPVKSVTVVLTVCTVWLLPVHVAGQSGQDVASTLEARIDSLRVEGKFADALGAAKKLLDVKQANPSSKPFELVDAEQYVSTLEFVVKLPLATQEELAEAYRLSRETAEAWKKSDYRDCVTAAKMRMDIFKRVFGNNHKDVAESLESLALCLHATGDGAGAEAFRRESLEISRKVLGPDHPLVALGLINLGWDLQARGDFAGAERLFLESLAILQKVMGKEHRVVILSLFGLATVLREKGNYEEAESLFRKALAISRKAFGNDPEDVASSLQGLANVLLEKGDYTGAEPLYGEALAIWRKVGGDGHPRVAANLTGLASVRYYQEDYGEAEPLYREALAILRKALGNEHPDVASALGNVGNVLRAKGDNAGAERLYREALAIQRKTAGNAYPDEVATSLNNLAGLLRAKGDYEGAELLFRESLEMRRKVLGPDHPRVATSLADIGKLLYLKRDYGGAERELSHAADVYEAARLRVGTGIERATFEDSPYPALALARLEVGKGSDAWFAVEKARGRVLMDLLVATKSRSLTELEVAQEDSLRRVLDDLEREVGEYQQASRTDTTRQMSKRFDKARDRLTVVEAEWAEFQREMEREHPIAEGQAYPLDRVQAGLGNDTAILGWLDVEVRKDYYASWAYVIRHDGATVWARVESPKETASKSLSERMVEFRQRLSFPGSRESVREMGREWWRERVVPVSSALDGVRDLVVIPSGAMIMVPVEALVDEDGRYAGDRFRVSYIPSATIYTWLQEEGSTREKKGHGEKSLLVGDPAFTEADRVAMGKGEDLGALCAVNLSLEATGRSDSTLALVLVGNDRAQDELERLPCTRLEVEAIARRVPDPVVLLGPEASEQKLVGMAEKDRLKEFGLIHVATHAGVDWERPERSAFVLSRVGLPDPLEAAMTGERIYDGLVTAGEVVREWKLDADLVTLSACETGLGKVVGGEGFAGLAHAFLQAGSRSLVVSLWSVDDRATSLLMQRFYENYFGFSGGNQTGEEGKRMTKAEALQEAKQWLRSQTDEKGRTYDHPCYWSAFVLIGER